MMSTENNKRKVFCLSMQRSGTSSVGKFFRDFGFHWAGWPADELNEWSDACYRGDYESIFESPDFKYANAFEDSPWFTPDFYKVLYHRFPGAKFILLTRDPDAWFKSLLSHSDGNIIGKTKIHTKIYRREIEYLDLLATPEFDDKVENLVNTEKTMKLSGHGDHYKSIYSLYNREVCEFFKKCSPESLHSGSLEDPQKWLKIGKFLNIIVPDCYESHENSSKVKLD